MLHRVSGINSLYLFVNLILVPVPPLPTPPIPSPITSSSSVSPLCSSITPSLFHSRIKTYLFHKSYPRSFTSSSWTAFTDFCPHCFFWANRFVLFVIFPYFFVSVPCARLDGHFVSVWAHENVSYRDVWTSAMTVQQMRVNWRRFGCGYVAGWVRRATSDRSSSWRVLYSCRPGSALADHTDVAGLRPRESAHTSINEPSPVVAVSGNALKRRSGAPKFVPFHIFISPE